MKYFFLLIILLIFSCNFGSVSKKGSAENATYLNHNDSVSYVGKETCKECHFDIYNSFIQTGMGQSFDLATKSKSVLDENNNPLIYDEITSGRRQTNGGVHAGGNTINEFGTFPVPDIVDGRWLKVLGNEIEKPKKITNDERPPV